MKKLVLAFLILAVAMAFAGTVTASKSYTVTFTQAVTVNGAHVAPGDYKLTIAGEKIVLQAKMDSKVNFNVSAKVETVEKKFDDTVVRYSGEKLTEIRLGGTKTRVVIAE